MITVELTAEEIRFLIQTLESECDQYLNQCSSSRLSVVRELAQRAVDQNNQLIGKLQAAVAENVLS